MNLSLLYKHNLEIRVTWDIKTDAKRHSLFICILNVRIGLHILVWKYIDCSSCSRNIYFILVYFIE